MTYALSAPTNDRTAAKVQSKLQLLCNRPIIVHFMSELEISSQSFAYLKSQVRVLLQNGESISA